MLLRRVARERGLRPALFAYSSLHQRPETIVRQLARRVQGLGPGCVHLVGHSLGGVIILRALREYPMPEVGRVVLLGSPLRGSLAARRIVALLQHRPAWSRRLLGPTAIAELLHGEERVWNVRPPAAMIAGTSPRGLGQLVAGFSEPSDGTVALSETDIPGLTARLELPVSHFGMLLSARVARETGSFLTFGEFGR